MRRRPSKPPVDPDDPAVARNRALRLLTRREHGADELKRKLVSRGVAPERAAETIEGLARDGWQSDARYVESMIRQRIAQGYGPLRIDAELDHAGVSESLIRQALAEAAPDWKALAVEAHARRFGDGRISASDWQKHYRHLAGRGFTSDQIYAVLKRRPDEDEAG